MKKKLLSIFFIFLLLLTLFTGCNQGGITAQTPTKNKTTVTQDKKKNEDINIRQNEKQSENNKDNSNNSKKSVDKNKKYTTKDDVALYIHTFGELPSNFIN